MYLLLKQVVSDNNAVSCLHNFPQLLHLISAYSRFFLSPSIAILRAHAPAPQDSHPAPFEASPSPGHPHDQLLLLPLSSPQSSGDLLPSCCLAPYLPPPRLFPAMEHLYPVLPSPDAGTQEMASSPQCPPSPNPPTPTLAWQPGASGEEPCFMYLHTGFLQGQWTMRNYGAMARGQCKCDFPII